MKKLIRIDASALDSYRIHGTRVEARLGSCNVWAEYRTRGVALYVYERITKANAKWAWDISRPFIWHAHRVLLGELYVTE